jgi:hypothetical protein
VFYKDPELVNHSLKKTQLKFKVTRVYYLF